MKLAECLIDAGVVEGDVHAAEALDPGADEAGDVRVLADVGLDEQAGAADGLDAPHRLLALLSAAAGDDHLRPRLRERHRGRPADARRAARH
jgi:hypothetical protein